MSESTDLAETFERYAPFVWRVVRRMGVAEADAEDVCQEVFLVVHRRLTEFEGRASLRTWIYGICLRCAAAYRNRAYHRREVRAAEPVEATRDAEQAQELELSRALHTLDQVLNGLPDKQREVYVLYELEELTMPEVAAAIGCPVQTAYSRLHAARREVRAAFPAVSLVRRVV